jgi:hypothetical protein
MRRTIRFLIDWAAMGSAGAVAQIATGSYWGMLAGIAAVAAYGTWCFIDGADA